MNILITGACAPISADLAQVLGSAGHCVSMADCNRWPIGRFSPYSQKFTRIPAPAQDFLSFVAAVREIIERDSINLVVPTSEEVFWLAQDPVIADKLFAPTFDILQRLHNKSEFAQMAQDIGAGPDFCITVSSPQDIGSIPDSLINSGLVAKPVYSRFGASVILKPDRAQLLALDFSRAWTVQSYVKGTEVCVYAVAHNGVLRVIQAYLPSYRAGKGASLYFEPVDDAQIDSFVTKFIYQHNISGQVSFDLMITPQGVVALECNPRGTSGVHLLAQFPEKFAEALLGPGPRIRVKRYPSPRMLGIPFLIYHGFSMARNTNTRLAWHTSVDATIQAGLPWYSGVLATCELVARAIRTGVPLTAASTLDFEWNGE